MKDKYYEYYLETTRSKKSLKGFENKVVDEINTLDEELNQEIGEYLFNDVEGFLQAMSRIESIIRSTDLYLDVSTFNSIFRNRFYELKDKITVINYIHAKEFINDFDETVPEFARTVIINEYNSLKEEIGI